MPQGLLPYAYETDRGTAVATAVAGLPMFLDLLVASGLAKSISRHVANRTSGRALE